MNEDLLQFIWRYQKFSRKALRTTGDVPLAVSNPGVQNSYSGPDFFNAQIRIGSLQWHGPVEVHLKSSSWYHHRHHQDRAYDAVILHVVWEHDLEITLPSGQLLPTLCVADFVAPELLKNYEAQFLKPTAFVPCESQISDFPPEQWPAWKEALFVERMALKVDEVRKHLKATGNDWEAVFFRMLCRGFGLNVNGPAFLALAEKTPFRVIRKIRYDALNLEALLMGQAGLLAEEGEEAYYQDLQKRYAFLKNTYGLNGLPSGSVRFSRLRPSNFPTVRLAQLSQLYALQGALFQSVVEAQNPKEASRYFSSSTTAFWKTHYNFGVRSRALEKRLSPGFFDLLLVNSLLPIRFAYAQFQNKDAASSLFEWGRKINPEHNTVSASFKLHKVAVASAFDTQSLLHLKKYYCDRKKCLSCRLGYYFLNY